MGERTAERVDLTVLEKSFQPQISLRDQRFERVGESMRISLKEIRRYGDGKPFTLEEEFLYLRPPYAGRFSKDISKMHYVSDNFYGLSCDTERVVERFNPTTGNFYWDNNVSDDVCTYREQDKIVSLLTCHPIRSAKIRPNAKFGFPNPHCVHRILVPEWEAEIEMTYPRTLMSDWREIERKVRSMFKGFAEQGTPTSSNSAVTVPHGTPN